MVKCFISRVDLEKLQSTYHFTVQFPDANSEANVLNENEVLVLFENEIQLVFICDDEESITAKIINKSASVLQTSVCENLECKMNQLLQRKLQQQNLTCQVEAVFLLLKTTLKEVHKDSPIAEVVNNSGENSKSKSPQSKVHATSKHLSGLKSSKKPPMKTALDVINRIKWDKSLDSSKFIVAYEDRFTGIVEKAFGEFDWDNNIASVGPDVLAIPKHRIQYFKYVNRVVWKKENRLDEFFGSTGSGKTILDVIREKEQIPDLVEDEPKNSSSKLVQEAETSTSEMPPLTETESMDASSQAVVKKCSVPNYFVGIRINRDDVTLAASKYLKQLERACRHPEEQEDFLQSIMPPIKYHVTLCVCALQNNDEIERVKQVLQRISVNHKSLELKVDGIGQFDQAVVFAKVQSETLREVQKQLVGLLEDEYIDLSANYPTYNPHMTLMKLPWRKKYLFGKIAQFVEGKKYRNWHFHNRYQLVPASELMLCKIQTTDEITGFYETLVTCPLQFQDERKFEKYLSTTGSTNQGPTSGQANIEEQESMDDQCAQNLFSELPMLDESETMDVSGSLPPPAQRSKRTFPTHFIGVRVQREDVARSAFHFINTLANEYRHNEEREEFMQYIMRSIKHHVTLCVCNLDNDDRIEKVKQVMQRMSIDRKNLELKLRGVGQFAEAVLYAKVQSRTLCSLERRLVRALQEENINLSANFPEYIPHMTLVKIPRNKTYLFNKVHEILSIKKYRTWGFHRSNEPVLAQELVLCKIRSTDTNTGFYETLANCPLQYEEQLYSEENEAGTSSARRGQKKKQKKRKAESYNSSSNNEQRPSKYRNTKDVFVSKSLTAILRHNKFGFQVDSEGYVSVSSVLHHQRFRGVSREDLHRIVETNDKKRFTIDLDEKGVERIKANQGHTVEVENLSLTEITDPDEYPVVVHGTFWGAWKSIQYEGLHRRTRIHIHMTTAEPSHNSTVISGMRKSSTVFIYIDIAAAMKDGIQFLLSSNGVILSGGDEMGHLKPKYFRKVIGISEGKRRSLLGDSKSASEMHCEEETDLHEEVKEVVKDMLNLCLQSSSAETESLTSSSDIPALLEEKML